MVSDDRGQLILIGAVAIALIVIGLVLVVNTALFTEVVGSQGTVETTKDGGVAVQELEDSVSAVVHNATVEGSGVNSGDVDDLDGALRNASVNREGAFVSLDYRGANETGTYVNRSQTNSFESTQTFVDDADVGYFVLFVDVGDSDGSMEVTVDDGSTSRTLDISESGDELDLGGAHSENCDDVSTSGDVVRIDLYRGAVYEQPQCTFDLFGGMDSPYDEVESSDADSFEGRFEYVTSENESSVSLTDATESTAVWSYDLAYEYHTDEVSTSGDREVYVYD